jgi:hypothetical protein
MKERNDKIIIQTEAKKRDKFVSIEKEKTFKRLLIRLQDEEKVF